MSALTPKADTLTGGLDVRWTFCRFPVLHNGWQPP